MCKVEYINHTEEFVKRILDTYGQTMVLPGAKPKEESPALPIIVGAGISCSAGIPSNAELLQTASKNLRISDSNLSYKKIYEAIKKTLKGEKPPPTVVKFLLRDFLVESGIPQESESILPNISNFVIIHLIRHGLLGPVISLNVDPLLSIAAKESTHEGISPIRFVVNISQFSDLLEDYNLKHVVFQPHGTIEEPLSLRFLEEELQDQDNAIQDVILNSLREATSIVCVGSSMKDGVALSLIKGWLNQHRSKSRGIVDKHKNKSLNFFVTSFEESLSESIHKDLERLTTKRLHICVGTGIDADDFFSLLADQSVVRTKKDRGESVCRFHVPSITRIRIRDLVFSALASKSKKGKPSGPDSRKKTLMPNREERTVLEIAMHSVTSRGPFSVADLVDSRLFPAYFFVPEEPSGEDLPINIALRRLIDGSVLSYYYQGSQDWHASKVLPPVSSINDILGMLFIKNPDLARTDSFTKRLCKVLSLGNIEGLSTLFRQLELDRESKYTPARACITEVAFSRNAYILHSHEELDRWMDNLKYKYMEYVQKKVPVECCIVSETGEHLFKPDELDVLVKKPNRIIEDEDVRRAVREWILPIYESNAPKEQQSLRILVAANRKAWPLGESRQNQERIISELVNKMGEKSNIKIYEVPWDKHNDHMWFYRAKTPKTPDCQGIYFPRPPNSQSYFGIHVEGETDVTKLANIFKNLQMRGSRPIGSKDLLHVIALTILDADTTDGENINKGSKILVVVRRPSNNPQHSNIACVPTERIPESLFWTIAGTINPSGPLAEETEFLNTELQESGDHPGMSPIAYSVKSILNQKLGLADACEEGLVKFRAAPRVILYGESPLETDNDKPELLRMLNIAVYLDAGKDKIPHETSSYSHLEWITVDEYLKNVDEKKPFVFLESSKKVAYKSGGLCVCTTQWLKRKMSKR